MKHLKNICALAIPILLLSSFIWNSSKPIFLVKEKKKEKTQFGKFVYVPSGKLYETSEKTTSLKGFYMMSTEVSNADYDEFLKELESNGETERLELANIQSEKWNQRDFYYGEPFVETYDSHPAYENYPVVNVSRKAAELYCEWLTEKWAKRTDTKEKLVFRLPTKTEWMYAARGGHDLSPFPWGGYYVRNNKGCYLANFKHVDESRIKYNRKTEEYEIVGKSKAELRGSGHITSPVTSYFPNNFGLYNMSGNVSEFLYDGSTKGGSWASTAYYLQISAEDEFEDLNGDASPYVGIRPIAEILK